MRRQHILRPVVTTRGLNLAISVPRPTPAPRPVECPPCEEPPGECSLSGLDADVSGGEGGIYTINVTALGTMEGVVVEWSRETLSYDGDVPPFGTFFATETTCQLDLQVFGTTATVRITGTLCGGETVESVDVTVP